ncbi:phosphorylase family protein [Micromonospora chalcea]|uniref:phosphorylase family protein n=1 Tax=Micromonospora chalcea TaxID=1874 RepID=UPI0037C913CF
MNRRPTENDILTLLALLRSETCDDIASIMFDDLVWSVGHLDTSTRSKILVHAAAIMGSRTLRVERVQEIFDQLDRWQVTRSVDFAVVTVKEREFDAAKAAFGVSLRREPDFSLRGAYFFDVEVAREGNQSQPLRGIITKCGKAGNSQMAAFLHTVFSAYTVRLCCLVGMAAGHRKLVRPGDVVFGNKIIDAGTEIATRNGSEIDGSTFNPDLRIEREMTSFRPERLDWHHLIADRIATATADLKDLQVPEPFDPAGYRPRLLSKTVIARDELVEDGRVGERARRFGPERRTGALEMEGAGFAAACIEGSVPWLVMRGIADFGEPERIKDWQFVSTVAAATAVRLWLASCRFIRE